MKKPKQLNLKMKFWGEREAAEFFKYFLDENFLAALSPIKTSDQGNSHAFATLKFEVE